jgi:YHS domain-containing protein
MKTRDPICGAEVDTLRARAVAIVDGQTWYFCSAEHKKAFLDQRGLKSGPVPLATKDRVSAPVPVSAPVRVPVSVPVPVPVPVPKATPATEAESSPREESTDDEPPPRRAPSPLLYLVALLVLAIVAVGLGLLARKG